MRKIGFYFNKNNCYIYGIDSHVSTNNIPTLIFRNGDEYHFNGKGKGSNFYYVKNSITPASRKIKTPMSIEDLETELFQALKRDGFADVIRDDSNSNGV